MVTQLFTSQFGEWH